MVLPSGIGVTWWAAGPGCEAVLVEVDRSDSVKSTFGEHRRGVGLVADGHGAPAAVSDDSGIRCNVGGSQLGNELHFREAW